MKKKTVKTKKLPARLSDLLDVALKDLRAVEKQKKKYKVDMSVWHEPDHQELGKCTVCMAGAVIARTLKVAPTQDADEGGVGGPTSMKVWDEYTSRRLGCIDMLRSGRVSEALGELYALRSYGGDRPAESILDRKVPEYGAKGFWPALRKLHRDLVKAGL